MSNSFSNNIKHTLAFTLIELIITLSLILILGSIVIIAINPLSMFMNARNSQRTSDLQSYRVAISRYISDPSTTGTARSLNDLTGYSSLLDKALNAVGGRCPGGVTSITAPVNGAFTVDNTSSTSTINISPLITNSYMNKLLKEPDGNNYKACIDTSNSNQLIIYSEKTENSTTYLSATIDSTGNSSPASTSPVAYYQFEEGSGSSVIDSSGNNYNLTWNGTGATHWTTGKYGLGANFNGTNDYLQRSTAVTSATSAFTISAWVKPTVLPQAVNYADTAIIVYNGDDSGGYGIGIGDGSGGKNSFYVGLMGSVSWFNTSVTLTANTWYYLSMTRDGSGTKFYINGSLVYTGTAKLPNTPSAKFTIGNQVNSFSRYFTGVIDEVKVYDYARTQAQITAEM